MVPTCNHLNSDINGVVGVKKKLLPPPQINITTPIVTSTCECLALEDGKLVEDWCSPNFATHIMMSTCERIGENTPRSEIFSYGNVCMHMS